MELFFAEVFIETFYVAVNWVFRCSQTSCFSISFWIFFRQMWCENSTLSDVKLRLFYFSFWKSEKVFIDCSRNTDANEELGVLRCNVQIWSSSLRFSFCDVSMNFGFEIAFLTDLLPQTSFFASEPFMGVYRGFHRELAHTVNSLADLFFERFWFLMLYIVFFGIFDV